MDPAVIIYPKNLKDILDIVDHARENKLGIAVRTGGHQYSGMISNYPSSSPPQYLSFIMIGASSTSGENIQIDLSETFHDPEADWKYDQKKNLLRVGISFSLQEVFTI